MSEHLTDKKEQNKKSWPDLAEVRRRLAQGKGRQTWRGLGELAETENFLQSLKEEFPRETSWINTLNRRDFLKLLAAPLALAGLSACVPQPTEYIVPYVEAPEEIVPSRPLFFATAMELDGYARGLLVESREGRPIKIEGNPLHPASLGATDSFAQGALLTLYDPDRAQVIVNRGRIRTWDAFAITLTQALSTVRSRGGAGFHLLTQTVTSPTLVNQIRSLQTAFPQMRWHQYDPVGRDHARAGAALAFDEIVDTQYAIQDANVILSLDSDFFLREAGNLRYTREWATRRETLDVPDNLNRMYMIESKLTITGAMADHRLPVQAAQVEGFTRVLARELGIDVDPGQNVPDVPEEWLSALVSDLQANQGSSLVIAGPQQTPVVHALAHAMNAALNNVGSTVFYTEPVEPNPVDQTESLRELAQALAANEVELLVVVEGNPVHTAPADLEFIENFRNAGLSIYLGLYDDETAELADWFVPSTHFLEHWSDTRAFDGTATIVQPLIQPLYNGISPHRLLSLMLGSTEQNDYNIVRGFWQTVVETSLPEADFTEFWRAAVHDGVVANTGVLPREVQIRSDFLNAIPSPTGAQPDGLELIFEPDDTIWDGRFANNAWLQELPKPLTKLTWDNAALISPRTALDLNLEHEELVELHFRGRTALFPIFILPGLPDGSVTISLGYGRRRGGQVAPETGFNAYALRTSDSPWFGYGLEIVKIGRSYPLATTQEHWSMEGRDLARYGTLDRFLEHPGMAPEESEEFVEDPLEHDPPSLYPEFFPESENEFPQWGMAINLNTCIGCNACVIACQAENNIPVVGKQQVLNSREMHWLRVDRYFDGDLDNPRVLWQPLPCMHCEKAPCEPVCPTEATLHDNEGLNEMIYNRCVGTRYCSNNCPYKVRRFNFFEYVDENVIPIRLMRNPEVTVRSRGVMEKCTYCIQRIQSARIDAQTANRVIEDGEVQTACQQVCPANAIIFGNIEDENSLVRRYKDQPRNYALLGELGTRPRTSYLARLLNLNPELNNEGEV